MKIIITQKINEDFEDCFDYDSFNYNLNCDIEIPDSATAV